MQKKVDFLLLKLQFLKCLADEDISFAGTSSRNVYDILNAAIDTQKLYNMLYFRILDYYYRENLSIKGIFRKLEDDSEVSHLINGDSGSYMYKLKDKALKSLTYYLNVTGKTDEVNNFYDAFYVSLKEGGLTNAKN